jgi:hypothetical protein
MSQAVLKAAPRRAGAAPTGRIPIRMPLGGASFEFLTADIRSPNTRRADALAAAELAVWCEPGGVAGRSWVSSPSPRGGRGCNICRMQMELQPPRLGGVQ